MSNTKSTTLSVGLMEQKDLVKGTIFLVGKTLGSVILPPIENEHTVMAHSYFKNTNPNSQMIILFFPSSL